MTFAMVTGTFPNHDGTSSSTWALGVIDRQANETLNAL